MLVNPKERVERRNTDQFIYKARGVHLKALWLCGRTADQMRQGDPVSRRWDAELEANPNDKVWETRLEIEQQANSSNSDNAASSASPRLRQKGRRHQKPPETT